MRSLRWLSVVAVPLLWSGVAAAQEKMKQSEFYPLAQGMTWTYEILGADGLKLPVKVTIRVAEFEKFGEHYCARLETSAEGQVTQTEHVTIKDDGVYRCAYAGAAIEPPVCIIKLPPRPGTKWKINQRLAGEQARGEFVMGEAIVDVPKYKGKTVTSSTTDMKIGDVSTSTTYYFAPNVGMVKQYAKINEIEVTLELKDTFVPKK